MRRIGFGAAATALALLALACRGSASGGDDHSDKEQTVNHEALVDRFIEAIESHDIEEVVQVYAPDGTQIHPFSEEPIVGHDGIRASDGGLLEAFPDVTIKKRGVWPGDGSVVVELVLIATHSGPLDLGDGNVLPATGRSIEVPSVWVIDVNDAGLITQERAYFDSAVFFRQLGLQAVSYTHLTLPTNREV